MGSEARPAVAVVQFPGGNCEAETARALTVAGCAAEVFRWNRDARELDGFAAVVIGGGFSYQDRVRSGVIAAREPICARLGGLAADGKPVLGICNGAQVLVETGLVPGVEPGAIEVALAPNRMMREGRVVRRDYYCIWTHLTLAAPPARCAFTGAYAAGEVISVPIAHGEGRFVSREAGLFEQLAANQQIVWQYCDPAGEVAHDFPVNPNGSTMAAAALCNPAGNVLAIMPHPERANWLRQVPQDLPGADGDRRRAAWGDAAALDGAGPGRGMFVSLLQSLQAIAA